MVSILRSINPSQAPVGAVFNSFFGGRGGALLPGFPCANTAIMNTGVCFHPNETEGCKYCYLYFFPFNIFPLQKTFMEVTVSRSLLAGLLWWLLGCCHSLAIPGGALVPTCTPVIIPYVYQA